MAEDKFATADTALLDMDNKNIINAIIICSENIGWHVNTNPTKNEVIFEFSKFTPAGQDFSFCAAMKGSSLYSFIREVEEYYEDFDPDEEAYLWLDSSGHGCNGAPYRMKDVLEDMEAAGRMVARLLETLQEMENALRHRLTKRKTCQLSK